MSDRSLSNSSEWCCPLFGTLTSSVEGMCQTLPLLTARKPCWLGWNCRSTNKVRFQLRKTVFYSLKAQYFTVASSYLHYVQTANRVTQTDVCKSCRCLIKFGSQRADGQSWPGSPYSKPFENGHWIPVSWKEKKCLNLSWIVCLIFQTPPKCKNLYFSPFRASLSHHTVDVSWLNGLGILFWVFLFLHFLFLCYRFFPFLLHCDIRNISRGRKTTNLNCNSWHQILWKAFKLCRTG